MKNKFFRLIVRCCFSAFFLCVACHLSATAQEYIFNRLTIQDGLSSNRVYAVWRDKQGYLWAGTETGLQRYDGYNFIYPRYHNDSSFPQQPVYQILEDKRGNVWLRTGATAGIFDIHTFTFRAVPVHFHNAANQQIYDYQLSKDADGNVYMVAKGYNWVYFNEKTFSFEQNKTPFTIPDSLHVQFVYDDKAKGIIWAGGIKGLIAYDKKDKTIYTSAYNPKHLPLLNDKKIDHFVYSLFIDSRRRYWIVNWDMIPGHISQNLYCYDEKKGEYSHDVDGLGGMFHRYFEYNHVAEFGDSNIIVYGAGCLALNQGHRFESFFDNTNSSYNITFSTITDVYQDKDKLLWVATDNGLYNTQAVTNTNQHLILDNKKARAEITSVLQYKGKNNSRGIWVGTWGGRGVIPLGKTVYDTSTIQLYDRPILNTAFSSVWDMVQHSRTHEVWIACQEGALQIYNPVKNKSIYLKPAAFKGSTIRQAEEDKNGNLWFGCHNGSIVKWTYGKDVSDSSFHNLFSTGSFVTDVYADTKGLIWISSGAKGVLVINPDDGKPIHQYLANKGKGSLSDDDIRQILQYNDSIYLIAGNVLNFLNIHTGKVTLASRFSERPIGKILAMQIDDNNRIWVSTTTGIYRYNKDRDTYKQYSQRDGLITVENEDYTMITGQKLDNSDLVFGGNQNLVVFNPKQYTSTQPPANVTITGISFFNISQPVDSLVKLKEIKLSHDLNSITVHFASLDFNQINKLTYYYQLQGADKSWIAAEQLQATYNLLPPGSYTFKVRSQNEEGMYSKDITEVRFYIRPSFWQSVPFYILLALATAGLLYYLHWMRVQRLLHVEKVRTRLARDLHDDMGSTLSTINILSNMAMQKAGTDEKTTKEFISRIGNNSSRMMEAMDDIVWSINPVNDSMQKVTARMKEFAGNALEAKDINYTFHIDEGVKDLHFDMDTRRSIFLIFKEAVNNILKYAEATEVCIDMQIKKKELMVLVKDNGKGFDPAKPTSTSRGNGVKNMQKRAETMKAKFHLQTEVGKGTLLELQIPVK